MEGAEHRPHFLFAGHVRLQRDRLITLGTNLLDDPARRTGTSIVIYRDGCAARCESPGNGFADTRTRAGNQRLLPLQRPIGVKCNRFVHCQTTSRSQPA